MTTTEMKQEIAQIPGAVAQLLASERLNFASAADAIRAGEPNLLATIARGSSDHAATYLSYASQLVLGLPVASLAPSIASIYGKNLKLDRAIAIGISQSGASPDIVAMLEGAVASGARTLAITNTPDSPLARAAHHVIDIHAGPELSVAATKTFITSVVAGLALVADWSRDAELRTALDALPEQLAHALSCDWSALIDALTSARSFYVLGRGPGMAVAAEAALKCKETSGLHAEAYSTAEVLHGPSAIVRSNFPVLILGTRDASRNGMLETARRLADQGARVFLADETTGLGSRLDIVRTAHPLTDPIAHIVAFYGFAEALARARGLDPDHPPYLTKVTPTQ